MPEKKLDVETQKLSDEDVQKAKKMGKLHGDPILVIE
jgi:hypothetical protein